MDSYPNKAVPGGCIIGLFGIFAWLFTAACGRIAYLNHQKPYNENYEELLLFTLRYGIISFLIGLVLVSVGLRLAIKTKIKDPNDSTKPMMRF